MFFVVLILIVAIGFVLQYFLGLLQIKHFTKNYTDLRSKGRVAIGRRPSIFKSGTLILLQINKKNEIEEGRYMQGVTVFTKFRKLKGLDGLKLNKITDSDLKNYNKLLVKAILDAQHTLNVIESGGEIEKIPSPLMKVVKKVNRLFKNERGSKYGLHR
ncbi:transcriptional regulator [Staphylococcus arlettae]|jgi:glucitol operon activator protein|uniref:transcriptional regulator GutM n=1 Tax=Staphylococcus TaxID=1279 RepID=UPI0014384304|nr:MULTISPECIES: transcriptional regulator GutM [Staphylococcus]HAP2019913.1 transcriptional regulator [Escherichia coli]MCD8833860.1 transcriptional regulator GutM [Staphylococcus arlettae]MCD8849544.1 transcriptional regulator GutM [Staphylococcus arlettae]NKE83562.1 transcriptional regulator [Staphylococcus arlettae]URN39352.1 transcriptional regulator GutM [Staphylococcus arlettae]